MTIHISAPVLLGLLIWLLTGGIMAWRMAISPIAVFMLILFAPVFLVLIVLAPVINWWVNREFDQ